MNISIIVPSYNSSSLLSKNIPKLLEVLKKYKNGNVELIITDDASKDNSLEVLYQIQKLNKSSVKIKLLTSNKKTNAGFSSNVDKGVNAAEGEIIILLNTDVFVEDDFLAPLLTHFNDDLVFAVGCLDKSIEEGKIVLRGRGIGKWEKGFFIHGAGSLDKDDTLWVSGGSGAFRKSMWDLLYGLDPLYNPFYWEDIDLSYRALKRGYKVLFENKSCVIHAHEEGVIKKQYLRKEVLTISYRNHFIFVWKNITDSNLLINHFIYLPYHLVRAIFKGDWQFISGFLQAIFRLKSIIKQRRRNKKDFKISDLVVINNHLI